MAEELTTPQDVFIHKLSTALQMEHTVAENLEKFQTIVQRQELKDFFRHHEEETRGQITRLERCFELLDKPAKAIASPAATGISKEADTLIQKSAEELVDGVVLASALGTEHYETAVYEALITLAEAEGQGEIVSLLEENLEEEQHTADEVKKHAAKTVKETVKQAG